MLNDVQGVGQMLQDNLVKLLQNAITVATAIVAIIWLDWRLAIVALALLPAFIVPTRHDRPAPQGAQAPARRARSPR